jgi:L-asparaginase II
VVDSALSAPPHAPLAVVSRGDATDSIHFGSVAVVDRDGRLLFSAGDPHWLTTTRSALKPLQAIPFAAGGGIERFGLSQRQIALLCASHSGEPKHVEAVADILSKIGCTKDQLLCGVQAPLFYTAHNELPPSNTGFSTLHHNCSGKHSGMLAYCRQNGIAVENYVAFDHPLQQAIRQSVGYFTGVDDSRLVGGIDGCSAPNYAVPLSGLALAYAKLACAADDARYGGAPSTLVAAMIAHPDMVSGERRSDFSLMRSGRGDWVTKVGAEAVQAIGVKSRGWGIAVKVVDGNARGLQPATMSVLDQLGLLDTTQRDELSAWREPQILNYRGTVTGRVSPVVRLDRHE